MGILIPYLYNYKREKETISEGILWQHSATYSIFEAVLSYAYAVSVHQTSFSSISWLLSTQ